MSDDMDESDDDCDDNDSNLLREAPFPDDCQDEVQGIESLSACFLRRYNACPSFYHGSLRSACQQAFTSRNIQERRPVLVYVHNDANIFTNIFCSNIFCSEVLIDYLLENYIVWPWDVTHDSNREKLVQLWQGMFSEQSLRRYSTDHYPLLITIMRRPLDEERWSSTSEYQWKPLLQCDRFTGSIEPVTRGTLLQQLVAFHDEFQAQEQTSSLDFGALTGLSPEVILKILQYLSLNDAVNAFSDTIVPLLREYRTRVHLSRSDPASIDMVLRTLDPEQIVSLRLNAIPTWPDRSLLMSVKFTNLISLTLVNARDVKEINKYMNHFQCLICLSLFYDREVDFILIRNILAQLRKPLKRFEMHSVGTYCSHLDGYLLHPSTGSSVHVKSFLIETGHLLLPSTNQCIQRHQFCFLTSLLDFLRMMSNLRHVRLLTDKHNLDQVLNFTEWRSLIDTCPQLKKIIVETWRYTSSGQQYVEKAMEMDTASHRR